MVCGGALACGSTSDIASDDGGGADGSQSWDGTLPSDAEGGGWQGPDGTSGDGGSVDANGGSDGGPSDASGAEGSTSMDSGESDASDASEGGIIIFVPDSGDDGPGAVEGGATVYFPCGPTLQCPAQTKFCLHVAGPTRLDGSFPETWDCVPIPATCEPGPTCSCLSTIPAVTNGCPCTTPQVGLEVDCLHP
jgi:hypothetical protein